MWRTFLKTHSNFQFFKINNNPIRYFGAFEGYAKHKKNAANNVFDPQSNPKISTNFGSLRSLFSFSLPKVHDMNSLDAFIQSLLMIFKEIPVLLIDENQKELFKKAFSTELSLLDNKVLEYGINMTIEQILSQKMGCLTYMCGICQDETKKMEFLRMIYPKFEKLPIDKVIQIYWIMCLVNDLQFKEDFIYKDAISRLKNKNSLQSLKIESIEFKYKFSQLIYDMIINLENKLDVLEELNLADNIEFVTLDDIKAIHYINFRTKLEKEASVNDIHADSFDGIYNLGLRKGNKIAEVVNIQPRSFDYIIFRMLKNNHLKLRGFHVMNLFFYRFYNITLTENDMAKLKQFFENQHINYLCKEQPLLIHELNYASL